MDFAEKHCVPCEGGESPMPRADAVRLLKQVDGWELVDDAVLKISKKFKFKNFKESLEFVNKVGGIAESEGHHPDINFGWGKVEITLYTHAIKGLFKNDFILASKIDKIS